MINYVNVFLYSEEEDDGTLIPVQYQLTDAKLGELLLAVSNNQRLLPFGNYFHETEDVLKFVIIPNTEDVYTKFDK